MIIIMIFIIKICFIKNFDLNKILNLKINLGRVLLIIYSSKCFYFLFIGVMGDCLFYCLIKNLILLIVED